MSPVALAVVGQEQSVGVILPSYETTIQRPEKRAGGEESSQSDHAREVTRVNRTRNNHDSAWKTKGKKRVMLSRSESWTQGILEMDRQARGMYSTCRGDEKRKYM